MNSGTLERREREHGFYVFPIEIDFYGKVHAILLVHLSDVSFDAILNKDINLST